MLVSTALPRALSRVVAAVLAPIVIVVGAGSFAVAGPAFLSPRATAVHAAAVADVTTTPRAKRSATYRAQVTLRQWRRSPHGHRISYRESHNVCTATSPDGRFRGKWQMTQSLWMANGGRTFARTPQRATCQEQDTVARRVWVRSWWWPWGG